MKAATAPTYQHYTESINSNSCHQSQSSPNICKGWDSRAQEYESTFCNKQNTFFNQCKTLYLSGRMKCRIISQLKRFQRTNFNASTYKSTTVHLGVQLSSIFQIFEQVPGIFTNVSQVAPKFGSSQRIPYLSVGLRHVMDLMRDIRSKVPDHN